MHSRALRYALAFSWRSTGLHGGSPAYTLSSRALSARYSSICHNYKNTALRSVKNKRLIPSHVSSGPQTAPSLMLTCSQRAPFSSTSKPLQESQRQLASDHAQPGRKNGNAIIGLKVSTGSLTGEETWQVDSNLWRGRLDVTEAQISALKNSIDGEDRVCGCTTTLISNDNSCLQLLLEGTSEQVREATSRARSIIQGIAQDRESVSQGEHTRRLMRKVPYPIAVVTAAMRDASRASFPETKPESGDFPALCALTASSFNTVTLTPKPVISLNIRKPSRSLHAITEGHTFYVHLLESTARGTQIADAFARGDAVAGFSKMQPLNVKIRSVSRHLSEAHGPWLEGEGIRGVMACRCLIDKTVDIGDHSVIFAEVLRVFYPSSSPSEAFSLLYVDGKYGSANHGSF